ncbi:hypothetical protein L208DRAFT_1378395 [Tricholoma matsutake]|nr:hypothetical protein L208DRAFT_1378395 [Tricholoma matsutake 945]
MPVMQETTDHDSSYVTMHQQKYAMQDSIPSRYHVAWLYCGNIAAILFSELDVRMHEIVEMLLTGDASGSTGSLSLIPDPSPTGCEKENDNHDIWERDYNKKRTSGEEDFQQQWSRNKATGSGLGDDEAEETEIGKDNENGSDLKNSKTGIRLEGE